MAAGLLCGCILAVHCSNALCSTIRRHIMRSSPYMPIVTSCAQHTHTHTLSLSLSHTHAHTLPLFLSLPLPPYTHTLSKAPSLLFRQLSLFSRGPGVTRPRIIRVSGFWTFPFRPRPRPVPVGRRYFQISHTQRTIRRKQSMLVLQGKGGSWSRPL